MSLTRKKYGLVRAEIISNFGSFVTRIGGIEQFSKGTSGFSGKFVHTAFSISFFFCGGEFPSGEGGEAREAKLRARCFPSPFRESPRLLLCFESSCLINVVSRGRKRDERKRRAIGKVRGGNKGPGPKVQLPIPQWIC